MDIIKTLDSIATSNGGPTQRNGQDYPSWRKAPSFSYGDISRALHS